MPKVIRNWLERQNNPSPVRFEERVERRGDDEPPAEHSSEQYVAWRATAIYNLGPFSAPPMR